MSTVEAAKALCVIGHWLLERPGDELRQVEGLNRRCVDNRPDDLDQTGLRNATLSEGRRASIQRQDIRVTVPIQCRARIGIVPRPSRKPRHTRHDIRAEDCTREAPPALVAQLNNVAIANAACSSILRIEIDRLAALHLAFKAMGAGIELTMQPSLRLI